MNPTAYNNLRKIFHQKVGAVQAAEMQQLWSTKTIEKETEYLYLIKQLLESYEDISLNRDAKLMAYERFLIDVLMNIANLYWANQVYFSMDAYNLIKIINTTENIVLKRAAYCFLEFWVRQEMSIAPAVKERQDLYKIYTQIPEHYHKLKRKQ